MVESKSGNFLAELKPRLRALLADEFHVNLEEVKRIGWSEWLVDDKNIFGEDAVRLAAAIRDSGKEICYVLTTRDVLDEKCSQMKTFALSATQQAIENFQDATQNEIGLNDTIIFPNDLSFLILRTGDVTHTQYCGSPSFIKRIKSG